MSASRLVLAAAIGAVIAAGCSSSNETTGLAVQGDQESLCVRYAKSRSADLKAQIAAREDTATMAAIDAGELSPGLPAVVAYCTHGAPIRRQRAAAPEGEIEHLTFCAHPIEAGEACDAEGPTVTVAADRIAANPDLKSDA